MGGSKRDVFIVVALWAAITLAGELLVVLWDIFPLKAAEEAEIVDDAFFILTVLAVPVFAFVAATLLYAVLRFGRRGGSGEDGPPIRGNTRIVGAWIAVTSALTVALIIFPGATGLHELRSREQHADMVVQVEGVQWFWKFTYPEQNLQTFNELVLPIDRRVRFQVTSADVIHAFWVPAFRVKIDAVPGRTTQVSATPNRVGNFEADHGFRVQCAELCGIGHGVMTARVQVVTAEEFQEWLAQRAPTS